MNARKLILLSLAALAIIIAAVWIGRSRAPESAAQQNLYPDLKSKLDSVTSISVFKAGDQLAVEIARDGDTWKVKQRGSYLADGGKVKSLL
ncbi:MAG TPA: hypothetical protein VET48_09410, partial [Steroidobacteraceae bacterium]|nr:hypothetical protein [Steroidobacteraceae bacterium]